MGSSPPTMALQTHRYDLAQWAASAGDCAREPQFRSITRLFNDSERVDCLYAASSALFTTWTSRLMTRRFGKPQKSSSFGHGKSRCSLHSACRRRRGLRHSASRIATRSRRRSWAAPLAALVILVILARTSGGVTINWCTPLQHLTAIAPTLCLPCALAEATRALPAPNTAAAARAEMARPAGP